MAAVSGIYVSGYSFDVEYNVLDIVAVYVGGGGINVWPILDNKIRLAIFDEVFKSQ